MLNLSDKDLDRFSKEAAQEYEPGEVLGQRSWERLEIRLDRDLGRVRPNLFRHIRRFPFYYAPAMLVLLGVSYYLLKRSGGPPLARTPAVVVQNPRATQNQTNTDKSTLPSSTASAASSADQAGGNAVSGGLAAETAAGALATRSATTAGSRAMGGTGASANAAYQAGAGASAAAGAGANARDKSSSNAVAASRAGRHRSGKYVQDDNDDTTLAITAPANGSAGSHGAGRRHGQTNAGRESANVEQRESANVERQGSSNDVQRQGSSMDRLPESSNVTRQASEKALGRSVLQGLRATKKAAHISDSSLRAFTLKSTAPQLIRKGGAHINRSLEFGVLLAPDFASVNSLAGDRPGSTLGLTVDYQFASHWYVGSGLLLDRKIFSARSQDFHAPPNFYADNGMYNVDLVKGSFEMLEIPLNLRYDFSVTGSTLFFASGGISSYLLTSENNNYYFRPTPFSFRDQCQSISTSGKSALFSALDLSLGVETGLSNSLSLLIAPYVKVPVRGVGIGQVQMSTVGINFSLKFAPVISRKRY